MKSYHGLMCPIINLSPQQILMQKYIPGPTNDNLKRRLGRLILFTKMYVCLDFIQGACTESLDGQVQGATTHPPTHEAYD